MSVMAPSIARVINDLSLLHLEVQERNWKEFASADTLDRLDVIIARYERLARICGVRA